MHTNRNVVTYKLFKAFRFFQCFFSSFHFLIFFAAVVDLLLGFLPVEDFLESITETEIFSREKPSVVEGNFAQRF